jgi:hypothetical protein
MAAIENARDLIDAVDPSSILPDEPPKSGKTRDVLSALFDTRNKVYPVGDRVPAWWTRRRAEVEKIVQSRVELYDTAGKVLKPEEFKGKSEREIKVAVLKTVNKDTGIDYASKGETYVDVAFDMASVEIHKNAATMERLGSSITKYTATKDAAGEAKDRMQKHYADLAGKAPGFSVAK